jgi:hypothetical protein
VSTLSFVSHPKSIHNDHLDSSAGKGENKDCRRKAGTEMKDGFWAFGTYKNIQEAAKNRQTTIKVEPLSNYRQSSWMSDSRKTYGGFAIACICIH